MTVVRDAIDGLRAELAAAIAPKRAGTSSTPGFDKLLAYEAVVGDGVMALKDKTEGLIGPLLGGFRYRGPDCESLTNEQVANLTASFNAVLKRLDFGTMLHIDAVVREAHSYIGGEFEETVDHFINLERRHRAAHYVTDYFFHVTQAPGRFEGARGHGLRRIVLGAEPQEVFDELEERVEKYDRFLRTLADGMGEDMRFERLTSWPDNDELAQALNLIVNGRLKRCRLPADADKMDMFLARPLEWTADGMRHGEDYVAVVGLFDYPPHSMPGVLSALTQLGVDLRWSTRFVVLDYRLAREKLSHLRRAWYQKVESFMSKATNTPGPVDEDAKAKVAEVDEALADLEAQVVRYGHFTSVVVLRGATQHEANEKARLVIRALEERGFEARIETHNKLEALLGSFPGHGAQNVRGPLMHSLHLAHLMPFAREWNGEEHNPSPFLPAHSPPLLQARTWSGGKFNLNLDVGDLGHTLILGPPGAGKSTLLGVMASQFMKYKNEIGTAQVIVLDQGASMLGLAMAHRNGAFYWPGREGGPQFCPLAQIDTEVDRAEAAEWIALLCALHGHVLTPGQRAHVYRAITDLQSASEGVISRRRLVHLAPHLLGSGIELVLEYYTTGAGSTVLNGDSDELMFADFTGFELEELMGYGPLVWIPTVVYLCRQIERGNDGRPRIVLFDEAWTGLSDPTLVPLVKRWFKTWRKKNVRLVLATQSLSDVADSEIANTVFDSCPTKILLPNPTASDSMRKLYADKLKLNDAQIELLTRVEKKRWYLYWAEQKSRLFTLDLGPVAKAFVGAGSKQELAAMQQLAQRHGEDWPIHWLEHRGETEAARAFAEHREAQALAELLAARQARPAPSREVASTL